MSKDTAQLAAIEAFHRALAAGAERETALDVALAKFRAASPGVPEFQLRTRLAKALASETLERMPSLSLRVH